MNAASQKGLPAKVAASQSGCQPKWLPAKVAVSQTWLLDKHGCRQKLCQPAVVTGLKWGKNLTHCQLCEKYFKNTKIVFSEREMSQKSIGLCNVCGMNCNKSENTYKNIKISIKESFILIFGIFGVFGVFSAFF